MNGYHHENDIMVIKDKIKNIFDEPLHYEESIIPCKCSFGIALMAPHVRDRKASTFLKAADHALYMAKKNGKNTCEFYDHELRKTITETVKMEHDLSNAAINGELELLFQPKMFKCGIHISGAEALLRWNSSTRGTISPAIFIPMAEKTLSILEIGKWVIEETCAKIKKWTDQGIKVLPIAVNVSPLQMQKDDFVDHVKETLEKYDVDPALLELEITETALMENLALLKDKMEALAKYGVKWVIDDFGVGYSSLTRLKELPISKIKIDRSFIAQIEVSPASLKICKIVILLANEFNLEIVVEGVEKPSQLNELMLPDTAELQGFYYSKPINENEFIQFSSLRQQNLTLVRERKVIHSSVNQTKLNNIQNEVLSCCGG
ncbi:MAG: GGDEF domain-containing protein [Emcibacteraceae bacterium]|nr:GGDEF domain-containing protein [Emcibacteraceae bacterium]